jgi:hypothetical protein
MTAPPMKSEVARRGFSDVQFAAWYCYTVLVTLRWSCYSRGNCQELENKEQHGKQLERTCPANSAVLFIAGGPYVAAILAPSLSAAWAVLAPSVRRVADIFWRLGKVGILIF